jgi:hypothetical protein
LAQKKNIQNGVIIQDGDFTNFKFWMLIENYVTKNHTSGFSDKLSISSGIELELGPSRMVVFDFLRHFVFFALIYFFIFFHDFKFQNITSEKKKYI